MRFLNAMDLKGKNVLELGAGTGLIALFAASHGAKVLASDINPIAIKNIQENLEQNKELIQMNSGELRTIQSDLFKNIEKQTFDLILINPPFYRGDVNSQADYAWYAGKELYFFSELFSTLNNYVQETSEVFMVLSDDAEINNINNLARRNQIELHCVKQVKNFLESNYIFKLLLEPTSIKTNKKG